MNTLIVIAVMAPLTWATWKFVVWGFVPSRHLPRNRVRTLRIRLRLRLHPARGHASAFECWLRWGRLAMLLHSARTRRTMNLWQRFRAGPAAYSVLAGRALYQMALRISLEVHVLVMAPPRMFKTLWLASVILRYPGPVITTSTKRDLFDYTSGLRAHGGRPVHVFCPQHIGGLPCTFRFNPIDGCEDEATAIRRSDAFAEAAISMGGVENASFWSSKASNYLRALFHAAALRKGDMRDLARWILVNDTSEAEEALVKTGRREWVLALMEMRSEADKTLAAIRMTMSQALDFLMDPALLDAVLPGADTLDIDDFLRRSGTLYMVAEARNDRNPLGPLFAVIAGEIHYRATQIGSRMPGRRIDPPVLFALDEITQTCPIPLPALLADAGGKGMQFIPVVHGEAQLASRWGRSGARVILDTCTVKMFLPGISDPATLDMAGRLAGKVAAREHGQEHDTRHPVMEDSMLREMPDRFGLIIQSNKAPVIAHLRSVRKDRAYRQAVKAGTAVAEVRAAGPAAPRAGSSATDREVTRRLSRYIPQPAPANGNGNGNGHTAAKDGQP